MKTSQNSTLQPKVLKHDTILIKQNPANSTIQNYKQEVKNNGTVANSTIRMVNNQSKGSIEKIIRLVIKRRLTPNKSALTTAYSDINEFNVLILRKSFEGWKNQCNEDCKLLYKDYQSQISFKNFKSIYSTELIVLNSPIQKRLDKFKKDDYKKSSTTLNNTLKEE